MRIAEVIGSVVLSRPHPGFVGATLKVAVPYGLDQLTGKSPAGEEFLVVWDELGASVGSRIAVSEGPEAARPFRPEIKAVDAYNAAILDTIDIQVPEETTKEDN